MSKNLNKVLLTGNLGADPETRYTPQGSAITTFRVASSRSWRTAEGEDREETEWFRVVAWNKLGEICAQYLQKGSRVYIEGRLQTRSWDDQATGQKKYMTEVVANDMIMLDSRRDSAAGGAPSYEEPDVGYPEPDQELEAPAQRSYAQRPDNGRAASPQPAARAAGNGNAAPARPAPQQRAAQPAAARRPAAPPPADEDDLPF
jgi:single-strand DNA-binding protein